MDSAVSGAQLAQFFALAPLVLGIAIYAIAWASKRHEGHDGSPVALGATYACAQCGRRSVREHMVPQTHQGAISYFCTHCA